MLVDVDVVHGGGRWQHDLLKVEAMAVLSRGGKQTSAAAHHRRCSSISCPAGGGRCSGSGFGTVNSFNNMNCPV